MEGADVFEEGEVEEGVLVLLDGDVRHLEDEVQEEEGDFADVGGQEEENVPDLFGGYLDEVEVFEIVLLVPDEIFAVSVIVFAQQLQELEGPLVGSDAGQGIDLLIGRFGLKDILPGDKPLVGDVEVVVVDGGDREGVLVVAFLLGGLLDVFDNELSQFGDEIL